MGDPHRLRIHNMGVIDIDGLNDIGDATSTSFTMAEVRARNPDWGRPGPRPTAEYPVSPHISMSKITGILEDFSIRRQTNRSTMSLRDTIGDYVFRIESTKNLLCIHNRSTPEFYYDRTGLRIPGDFPSKQKNNCPRVLIVSDSETDAIRVEQWLIKEQRKLGSHRGVYRLKSDSATSCAGVMVGSIVDIFNFFNDAKNHKRMEEVKEFLKFIVINNTEKLLMLPELRDLLDDISDLFRNSWTRFIFMYRFAAPRAAPILDIVKICHEKLLHGMFIEVETPRVRNIFERVEFSLAVPAAEYANRKAVQEIVNGRTLPERTAAIFSHLFTAQAQKLIICTNRILKLRQDRERKHRNQAVKRRERILVLTKSSEVAIMVMMSLRRRSEMLVGSNRFNVDCILTQDSQDNAEIRNFEFKHGTLDVLVMNWESINSVIRGTVDAVILFDSPPAQYFQTFMETEMENLTSRICVKIKLYILLDQQTDQSLLPEYVKFLQKYKRRAPQWFQTLYEKYRAEYNANLEALELEMEYTLTGDDTLR